MTRICECGMFQVPAKECPTGRCRDKGRLLPEPDDPKFPYTRSETLPPLSVGAGHRWAGSKAFDPAVSPSLRGLDASE